MEWVDSTTAYVFETYGVYYKTVDGGASWEVDSIVIQELTSKSLRIGRCNFVTKEFGVVALRKQFSTNVDSIVLVTTNGGKVWKKNVLSMRGKHNSTGTSTIPLQNRRILHCYGRRTYIDSLTRFPLHEEVIAVSTDLGNNWEVQCSDTLDRANEDPAFTAEWLLVDSLTMYKFTWESLGDKYTSYAKGTTDGGETWNLMQYPHTTSHPLWIGSIGGRKHMSINRSNDTGLVVVMGWTSGGAPGFGMATKDIRKMDTDQGWVRVEANSELWSELIIDMVYYDQRTYYIKSSGDDKDSLVIINDVNNGTYAYPSPVPLGVEYDGYAELYVPAKNKLFLWTSEWGLWKFNHDVLDIQNNGADKPKSYNIETYPVPYKRESGGDLMVVLPWTNYIEEVAFQIHDVVGRRHVSGRALCKNGIMAIDSRILRAHLRREGMYVLSIVIDGRTRASREILVK
jgi:hypothetical protein